MWFRVCGAPVDDWVDGCYLDAVLKHAVNVVLVLCWSWLYSKKCVWELGAKSMLYCFRKVK